MRTKRSQLGALILATAALILGPAINPASAQVSSTAPKMSDSSAITPLGPQRQQPPSRQQPAGNTAKYQNAPSPLRVEMNVGTVEGFVYWDSNQISHIPASSCSGLAITVSVGSSSTGPLVAYTPMATLTNNFKYLGKVTGVSGGKTVVYDVCAYGYDHVPVGSILQVKLTVTQPFAFSPIAAPQFEILGPVTIINGKCNMLPRIMNPTAADLTGSWGSCQNMAYDVSFGLVHPQMLHTLSSGGGSGGMLGGSAASGTLLNRGATSARQAINPPSQSGSASSPSSGVAINPGVKNTDDLNPQPYPPKSVGVKTKPTQSLAAVTMPAIPPKAGRKMSNPRLAQVQSSIMAVLEQQHQVAKQEYAAMKLSLRPAMTAGLQAGSTENAPSRTTVPVSATLQRSSGMLTVGTEKTMDETNSTKASITHATQFDATIVTCTHDPTPRILKVSGSDTPGVLTPEGKYNLYTIAGCSFGPSRAGNIVRIYGPNGFKENLNIDFWGENEIAVHFDPFLAGVLDQNNVTLVVEPAGRQPFQKSGFKFYAARGMPGPDGNPQEVQMSTYPQSSIALGDFSPMASAYDSVTQNTGSKYRFFWSFKGTPVAAWVFRYAYGHGDMSHLRTAECFIDEVPSNDDKLCTAFGIGTYSGTFNGWKPQTDQWDLAKLVPGFYVSSYQLFTDNPDPNNLCGAWDDGGIPSKSANLNGNWDYNLTSNNQIVVNWGLNYCGDHEANFAGRNNMVVQSSYGLAVWVMGPRCVDPWTAQPDQRCMASVRQQLGS